MLSPENQSVSTLLIGTPDADHLRVTLLDWETPGDREWIAGHAEIRSGTFAGSCRISLSILAFPTFRDQVQSLVDNRKGVARLVPVEPWLTIGLQRDCFDSVEAVCALRDNLDGGNELRTRFVINSNQLTTIVQQLDRIMERFAATASSPSPLT